MKLRPMLLGAILCLVLVNRASSQCLCASKGMDFCSCAAAPPPLRPVPKTIPRLPLAKFPPIGDSCWCGKQLVEPAIPPKPTCKPPAPPCKCCCECAAAPPPRTPTCFDTLLPPTPAPAPCVRPPGVPADPLSISMALTANKGFAVPEAKLSYGPVATPLNGFLHQRIYFRNIPEEKLYGLNGQIIEKKKTFPLPTKAELLAEAIEEAEEEQAAAVAPPTPYLSYSDLGYGPAMMKKPVLMRLTAQPQLSLPIPALPAPCDYVPGKVRPSLEYLEQPLEYGAQCL